MARNSDTASKPKDRAPPKDKVRSEANSDDELREEALGRVAKLLVDPKVPSAVKEGFFSYLLGKRPE